VARPVYRMFPSSAVGAAVDTGGVAGSIGNAVFAVFAGTILQVTPGYASLFGIASSTCLLAGVVLCLASWNPLHKAVSLRSCHIVLLRDFSQGQTLWHTRYRC